MGVRQESIEFLLVDDLRGRARLEWSAAGASARRHELPASDSMLRDHRRSAGIPFTNRVRLGRSATAAGKRLDRNRPHDALVEVRAAVAIERVFSTYFSRRRALSSAVEASRRSDQRRADHAEHRVRVASRRAGAC